MTILHGENGKQEREQPGLAHNRRGGRSARRQRWMLDHNHAVPARTWRLMGPQAGEGDMARRCIASRQFGRLHQLKRRAAGAAVLGLAFAGAIAAAHAQGGFPFGRELIMDTAPMPGTKRLPILDIAENGLADIDLWCVNVKVRLIVVADTITVLVGPKSERSCAPEQSRRDEETLAALSQATNWRLDDDVLVLTGGKAPLRFRLQTN
jgi:hypothetical protein